jgi:hypothetical protein
MRNGAEYIGIVVHYSSEENALHMRRLGLLKSDITWYNVGTLSEEAIMYVQNPVQKEMQKYLKNTRDLLKNESVH